MKFAASLPIALGLLLAASGCNTEPVAACTTANCTGCCDRNDQCQVGVTTMACGAGGNTCDVCVSPQICQLGRCANTASTGGGFGGGSGGGTGGGVTGGGIGGGTGGGTTGGGVGGGTGGGITGGGTGGGGGGGGSGTPTVCNTTGVATGCTAGSPFSCDAATTCFGTYASCVSSGQCPGSPTGGGVGGGTGGGGTPTGGGSGGGTSGFTCNTTGTATGCTAASPFSCDSATSCFTTRTACQASPQCGGAGTGGGTGGGGTGGGGTGGGGGVGSRTVTGRVTYDFVPARYIPGQGGSLSFNLTSVRPVRNAVVRVVEGSAVLASTNTAADGTYALSFTPGTGTLQVQVLARTSTPAIQIEDNTAANVTWGFGNTLAAGATTLDLHAGHGWTGTSFGGSRRAAPFAILDSMYTAARAFIAVRPAVNFPSLKVNWSPNNAPQSGDKNLGQIRTSHYSSQENEIYVLGMAGADIDEFDSHVIVHEWGHYFEEKISRSDSPGGPHGGGDVLDPRIAFGEAWGTAVAAMVLPETMYVDSLWSSGTLYAWGYDAESVPSPTDDPTPNAFSEKAVLRAIYDLYDSTTDGAHDQVGVGLGVVYDVVSGPQRNTDALTTLASFVTGLKAQPGANAAGINAVLAHYTVGPVTSDFGAGDGNLSGMFTSATIPFSGTIGLGGGFPSNSYQQNQYYVFTGTGRNVIVTANAAQDMWIAAFRRGQYADWADDTATGTESFSFPSQAGAVYVVVVQGRGQMSGNYNVTLSITSP
jgi:hypothetical protein